MKNKTMTYEKSFFLLVGIIGFIMLFLIPTWQTPDELTHLKIIGSSIRNERFSELLLKDLGFEENEVVLAPDERVDLKQQEELLLKTPSYSRKEVLPHGISISIISHFPSTMGMIIAIIIGLPTYWVLQVGEFFSLIFYLFVCYYSLTIMPIKKGPFAICMALPMALQQAGSIGYDAVELSLCFFFISYIFFLKYKESYIVLKDICILIACWMLITYIKIPYTFLILLIFLVPLEKYHFSIAGIMVNDKFIKKWCIPVCIIGIIVMCSAIYVLRDNRWIQVVYGCIMEWKRTLYLFQQTIIFWGKDLLVGIVGRFGWLDISMNLISVIVVYVFMFFIAVAGTDGNRKFNIKDKVIVVLTIAALFAVTMLSMVNHTIMVTLYGSEFIDATYNIREALYQIPYIGGVQGRYFLPILPLVFLLIPQFKEISKKRMCIIVSVFEVILAIYVCSLFVNRYWIL